jgi:L-cysteate sulfo-lyase
VQAWIKEIEARLSRLPRARLAHLPTPLDECGRLSQALNGPRIMIKRDDCTGLSFGGNKTRQLEYVLGCALAEGADCVILGAASQSNHARQLSAAGAKLGLDVHLVLKNDAFSSPIQGNLLVDHLLGPEIHRVPADTKMWQAKSQVAERLREKGRRPYIVGMGATETLVVAALAYVGAFVEMAQQLLDKEERLPDWIYTTSQGRTQAGLLLGARLLGAKTRVVGVNPTHEREEGYLSSSAIAELVDGAAEKLGYEIRSTSGEIVNTTDFVGDRYGVVTEAGREAISLLGRHEGILLDPVYSGKGFAGLLSHVREGRFQASENVVFVHTGGLPALFAYASDLVRASDATPY